MADAVWFYCYFVWVIKLAQERPHRVLKYILGVILITFFSLCAVILTGLWNEDVRYMSWILLTFVACAVFYVFDNWNMYFPGVEVNNRVASCLLWGNFVAAVWMCFLGHTGGWNILWLLASVVALAGYVFAITKQQIKEPGKFIPYIWGIFLTFNFITFTRIWFRAQDTETVEVMLDRLFNGWGDISLIPTMVASYKKVFLVILMGMVVHWLSVPFKERYTKWFVDSALWVKILICVFTVFMLYQVKASDLQPFIYFQF
jgi:hypothetical protein